MLLITYLNEKTFPIIFTRKIQNIFNQLKIVIHLMLVLSESDYKLF